MPQYDLAGNPLPESVSRTDLAGNPLPAPTSEIRYDLAGNPIPASAPPPPTHAPPPPVYSAGQNYPSARPTARATSAVSVGMQEAVGAGANWIWAIVGLSVVSVLLFHWRLPYVSSIGLQGPTVLAEVMGAGGIGYAGCVIGGLTFIALFAVLGWRGGKGETWAFAVALLAYALDMIFVALHFSLFGLIWHGVFLSRLFAAFAACREITRTTR